MDIDRSIKRFKKIDVGASMDVDTDEVTDIGDRYRCICSYRCVQRRRFGVKFR